MKGQFKDKLCGVGAGEMTLQSKAFAGLIEDQVQFPHGSLKPSATTVSGDPTPSYCLCRYCTHMAYIHTSKQKLPYM